MYSNLIDRAGKPDCSAESRITAESYFFQTILNGNHPTLVLPQTFDSDLVLSLMRGNQSKHFLAALDKGLIRVSPYSGVESVQEYLLQVLTATIEDQTGSFHFSCFPFLYSGKYSDQDRKNILSALRSQLQNSIPSIRCDIIDGDERQFFNEYAELIHRINQASFSAFLKKNAVPQPLPSILQKNIRAHQTVLQNTSELSSGLHKQSLSLYGQLAEKSFYGRSGYYNYLDSLNSFYNDSILQEARELVDLSYHETIASSICDMEPANIHIPDSLPLLTATTLSSKASMDASKNILTPGKPEDNALSWEDLVEIVTQVDIICQEKTCSWHEGLRIYRDRQQRLPIILGTKYAAVTSVTLALSSIPLVGTLVSNVTSELLWSAATDALGECMKKPSFKEIIDISKDAKKKCDLIKAVGSATSINMNSSPVSF